ncbi:mannosyltransferase putative-domain-containing protein [Corynascus similis CBS 632.67]
MLPGSNLISRYVNIATKTVFIIAALLVLNAYLTRGTIGSWRTGHDGGHPNPDGDKAPPVPETTPLNITQWGERGIRVKQLAHWAEFLIQSPARNRTLFETALVTQFPYLAGALGSIYTPWALARENNKPRPPGLGIVICAGSSNFHLAAHLIRNLRRVHRSQTPIEIAYAGDEDLKPEHRRFLSELEQHISFIDLLQRFPAARQDLTKSGWAIKPFALLASAYPRAILMDADALFLTSPDSLFEIHPALKRTGTLFFHDRALTGGNDERRSWLKDQIQAAGIEPSEYLTTASLFYEGAPWFEADSGVVALDKTIPKVLLGLMFAAWMNTKEVRDQVTYRVFYGDKETFWLAMELSGFQYSFQPWYTGTIGTISEGATEQPDLHLSVEKLEICGTHVLHLDHLGQTPFWINSGVYEDKNKPDDGYAKMTHYWGGNPSTNRLTQPQWYWKGNIACLKEVGVKVLPDQIKATVNGIQEAAIEVDQMIRHL